MILSFLTKETRAFHAGDRVKRFEAIARAAQAKLDRLDTAKSLADLALLPGNRLEGLKGDRDGQYSIRINNQWRLCFAWDEGASGPSEVEIVDYH